MTNKQRINEGKLRPGEYVEWNNMKIPYDQWNAWIAGLKKDFPARSDHEAPEKNEDTNLKIV